MHDLVIEHARIVDGTGRPAVEGSVAVTGGRITAVGGAAGQAARQRLDAEGRVLAPGFIDPHTHYDAQVAWDPLLTCSSWHGITTVVTGNFPVMNQDPEGVRPLVTDPRFLIGLSDGGAHVDQLCDAGYATYLLGKWVRERQALTLEEGVRRLTSEVARFFGIPDRGVIAPGKAADLVLFDPETVDDVPPEYVHDLPGGGKRLVARARGIVATIVAGQVLYRDGRHTGAMPGAALRSAELS